MKNEKQVCDRCVCDIGRRCLQLSFSYGRRFDWVLGGEITLRGKNVTNLTQKKKTLTKIEEMPVLSRRHKS